MRAGEKLIGHARPENYVADAIVPLKKHKESPDIGPGLHRRHGCGRSGVGDGDRRGWVHALQEYGQDVAACRVGGRGG